MRANINNNGGWKGKEEKGVEKISKKVLIGTPRSGRGAFQQEYERISGKSRSVSTKEAGKESLEREDPHADLNRRG